MKKALFLVNTPYQLMLAISLRNTEFKKCEADVAVTDRIADHHELAERLRKQKCFDGVMDIPVVNEFPNDKMLALKRRFFGINYSFEKKYDFYLFVNLNHDASGIYRELKKKNPHLHVYMFEDGYATYSAWYSDFLSMFGSKVKKGDTLRHSWFKLAYHRYVDNVFSHVEKMYVLSPEVMTYIPAFDVQRMDPIDFSDQKLLSIYNCVFGFDAKADSYEQKVIFFEESYYADGYSVNDVDIVEQIASIVGKENIFIKIHPRNPKNRFAELGYATNRNTSIPWEVIAMNIDLSDKILITIASVAVIVPCTMLGKKYKGILLMGMLNDDSFLKKNITSLYEEICNDHAELNLPRNKDELLGLLSGKEMNDE